MSGRSFDQDEPEYQEPRPRRPRPRGGDDGLSTLIPYNNPKSLVSYYCGVFGLIPGCGLVLGPIALIFGILALNYVKRHPTAKGTGHAITGIVLGSLSTLGHLVVLILIAIGIASSR